MSSELEAYVRELVKRYATVNLGIKNPKLVVSAAARNGDNFASDVSRVEITDGDRSDSDEGSNQKETHKSSKVQLIIKTSPQDALRRQMYSSSLQFTREHYTYNIVFPALEKFQRQYLLQSQIFAHYPKILQSSMEATKEFIILEDLCPLRYHTSYRPEALSFAKCMSVIKTLAQFHAISFAYKDQRPDEFEKLTNSLVEITFKDRENKILDPFLYRFIECGILTLSDSEEDRRVKGRLEQFQEVYASLMRECVDAKEDAVILHGDCWMSNLMFRKELDEIDVRLIDWQGTRYGSPAIDLSYFLFCCADSKVRVELPKILDFYHEELIKRITELGSDGAKLFSHSNLEEHMKKYARFGLGMAILTLHVITCDPDEMPNIKDTVQKDDNAQQDNIINYLISKPAYRERMSGVCRDAIKYGYL